MPATVYVRDAARVLRGPLPVLSGTAVLREHAVGSWEFTMDAGHDKAARVVPGTGVVVIDEESTPPVLFSGPVTSIERTADADSPRRTLAFSGLTDDVHVTRRVMLPDPTRPDTQQSLGTDAYYIATGAAETVAKTLVNLQAGPGAIVARRTAGLVIETTAGLGATVTVSARFKPSVGDVLAELGALGGIAWRVVYDTATRNLVFRVSLPRDLTRRVRFSRELGNLAGFTTITTAPTLTDSTIAGQGDLIVRTIQHAANVDAASTVWGLRLEDFLDRRDTDTDAVLLEAGAEALAQGGPASGVSFDAIDLPRIKYGRDYGLSDLVTVEDPYGTVTDQVRQVTLSWTPGGVRAKPLVGPLAVRDPDEPPSVRVIKQVRKRLGRLEGVQ